MNDKIRFEDGAGYESYMGVWSRLVGEIFLDWLRPEREKSWIDIGCGNGAFTELIAERAAPTKILGIDPSEAQIAFARSRHTRSVVAFEVGDAMALPAADQSVDLAVSALVLFFLPDPALGVREMARVVRPGGLVAAYLWHLEGGGSPYAPIWDELRAIGHPPLRAPHPEAAELAELSRLWTQAGLTDIKAREITVSRRFPSFEDYWVTALRSGGIRPVMETLSEEMIAGVKERMKGRFEADGDGAVHPTARAHAVVGRSGG